MRNPFLEFVGADQIVGGYDQIVGADPFGADPFGVDVGADDVEQLLASVGAGPGAFGGMQFGQQRGGLMTRQQQALQARAMHQRALQAALVQRQAAAGVMVTERAPQNEGEIPLNFDSGTTLIAAGASQVINAQPQCLFKPTRLVMPSSIGPNFLITDLTVMNQSILATGGVGMLGLVFSEQAIGTIKTDKTCQPVGLIQLSVTNISLASARAFATLFGKGAR